MATPLLAKLRARWFSWRRVFQEARIAIAPFYTPAAIWTWLLVMTCAVCLQLTIAMHYGAYYERKIEQAFKWDIASIIARELEPELQRQSRDKYTQLLIEAHSRHPEAELYLLDSLGFMLEHQFAKGQVPGLVVSREPLKLAIQQSRFSTNLTSDDPLNPGQQVFFSVAKVSFGSQQGFLYVVLRGKSFAELPRYFGPLSLYSILLTAVVATIVALIMFMPLFRRIRALNESAGNLAHDLKAPLTSIHSQLETMLLQEDRLPLAKRRALTQSALNRVRSLSSLVIDLMQLWRYESSEMLRRAEPLSIVDLAGDTLLKFKPQAMRKGVALQFEALAIIPVILGDIVRLERAISNLLDNAIRFTPAGKAVTLSIRMSGPRTVLLAIQDQGPGLSKREATLIFERFYSAHSESASDQAWHSGLGLPIARKIILAHAGKLTVNSQPGHGARFEIRLPALISARSVQRAAWQSHLNPMKSLRFFEPRRRS